MVDRIERLRKINDTDISCASAFNIAIIDNTDGTNCMVARSSFLNPNCLFEVSKRSQSVDNAMLKDLR